MIDNIFSRILLISVIKNQFCYSEDYINDRRTRPQNDKLEAKPPCEIRTIFGGPHFTRKTRGAQDRYIRETKDRSFTNIHSVDKRPAKQLKGKNDDITFR